MIENLDVQKYFDENAQKASFAELSKNKTTGAPLVESLLNAYSYEEHVLQLFSKNALKMVDALYVQNDTIWLIEFKGGFNFKIPLNGFDMSKWYCPDATKICDAGKYFKENQHFRMAELIDSICGKMLETHATFFRLILPKCCCCDKKYYVKYVAVVDASSDPIEQITDIQCAMAGTTCSTPSPMSRLKDALKKYDRLDSYGKPLFFDQISVWSIEEFNARMK